MDDHLNWRDDCLLWNLMDILIVQVLIWNRISYKGTYVGKTTLIKALAFGGKEKPINPGMVSMQKQ
jgi:hypothetical protein